MIPREHASVRMKCLAGERVVGMLWTEEPEAALE